MLGGWCHFTDDWVGWGVGREELGGVHHSVISLSFITNRPVIHTDTHFLLSSAFCCDLLPPSLVTLSLTQLLLLHSLYSLTHISVVIQWPNTAAAAAAAAGSKQSTLVSCYLLLLLLCMSVSLSVCLRVCVSLLAFTWEVKMSYVNSCNPSPAVVASLRLLPAQLWIFCKIALLCL